MPEVRPPYLLDLVGRDDNAEFATAPFLHAVGKLGLPVVAKYGFDPLACRFLSEWWPEGQKEKAITELKHVLAIKQKRAGSSQSPATISSLLFAVLPPPEDRSGDAP